jgi:hypothetical protein
MKEDYFAAALNDDDVYMNSLQWATSMWPFAQVGADWYVSHAEGPGMMQ